MSSSALPPLGVFDIEIPGTEYGDHIRFVFTASHATEYWEEGSEVCFDQLELRPVEYAPVSVESPVEIREEPLYITVASGEMEYRFSRRLSAFDSIKRCGRELLDRPMQFNFFRAPTDNDVMKGDWYGMHLHDSKARNYGVTAEVQGNAAVIRLRQSFGWSIHQPFVYLDVEYRISGGMLSVLVKRPGSMANMMSWDSRSEMYFCSSAVQHLKNPLRSAYSCSLWVRTVTRSSPARLFPAP